MTGAHLSEHIRKHSTDQVFWAPLAYVGDETGSDMIAHDVRVTVRDGHFRCVEVGVRQ